MSCSIESTFNYTFNYKSTSPYFDIFRNKGNKGYISSLFSLLNHAQRLNFRDVIFIVYCGSFVNFSKLSDIINFTNWNEGMEHNNFPKTHCQSLPGPWL